MQINITYHGHACFTLECNGTKAVIDPYAPGYIPGLKDLNLEGNAVYCSHGHGDHNYTRAVTLSPAPSLPWTVTEFDTAHDEVGGAKRGRNTVRIFDFGGTRVAHLGDIGCFPNELLLEALKGVDCLLLPVGGYYTVNAQTAYQIMRSVNPRVTIPMHYSGEGFGFEEIAQVADFAKLCSHVTEQKSPFVLNGNTEKQVCILGF